MHAPYRARVKALALGSAAAAAVLVALSLPASGTAGCSPNRAWQDRYPVFSAYGTQLAFARETVGCSNAPDAVGVVGTGGGTSRFFRLRGSHPTWLGNEVVWSTTDGKLELAPPGLPPTFIADGTWPSGSPDGTKLAYVSNGELLVRSADGTTRAVSADSSYAWDVTGPVWSPDGTRIAFATGSSFAPTRLEVVNADGSNLHTIATGDWAGNPSWSPDGTTIAFEQQLHGDDWEVYAVGADGSGLRDVTNDAANDRFPQFAPHGDRLAFVSDRAHVRGGASPYRYALYVLEGTRLRKLADDVDPASRFAWAPTALQIAFAQGGECGRWGIVIEREDRAIPHRLTNECRFVGTARADVLKGSPFRDTILGLAGNDWIEARDGRRDVIDCGPGNDTAIVDRHDVVRNCERVLRG
jgi:dipeptidyl aminopeptidase/acylaminoacyl peptidase